MLRMCNRICRFIFVSIAMIFAVSGFIIFSFYVNPRLEGTLSDRIIQYPKFFIIMICLYICSFILVHFSIKLETKMRSRTDWSHIKVYIMLWSEDVTCPTCGLKGYWTEHSWDESDSLVWNNFPALSLLRTGRDGVT